MMKQFRFPGRLPALLLALSMVFSLAACGGGDKPEDPSSSAPSASVPAFINPLPDVDLSKIAKPNPPSADLLAKINTAYNQNDDVVGWLKVPNTTIDNEVLFNATDGDLIAAGDISFYERRDITKAYSWYGCYWADYESVFGDRNSISQNTVVYGHSMDDNPEGVKFSQLKKYADQTFAENNPYIYFSTPEDDMVWEVFSVAYTDVYWGYNHPQYTNEKYTELLTGAKERSKFNFDVDVNSSDKILTLSACTYPSQNKEIYEQARFVIMARLVRPGETLKTTTKVTVNPSPVPPTFK